MCLRIKHPPVSSPQLLNTTVKTTQSATHASPPAFDYAKFRGGYRPDRLDPNFPERGVFLPIPNHQEFGNTLDGWDMTFPQKCEQLFGYYLGDITSICSWETRIQLPEECLIEQKNMMVAGLLQLDRKIVRAAYKRLYGHTSNKLTKISFDQLRSIAFALWNPIWATYRGSQTWAEFIHSQNRIHQREVRRQAQVDELLAELG